MSRTIVRRVRVMASIGALVALAATACTSEPPPPPSLRVDRGSVDTTVSASGTLVGISEQNLGFPDGGKITEVNVAVGDTVEAGQSLAKIDNFELRQILEQEQANLAQQVAELDRARGSNQVSATGRTLAQAREILNAVKKQVAETNEANRSATDRARKQLDFDRGALDKAKRDLRRAEDACDEDPAPAGSAAEQDPGTSGSRSGSTTTTRPPATNDSDEDSSGSRIVGSSYVAPAQNNCPDVTSAKSAVETAKRNVLSSETALDTAEHAEDTDAAAGRVSIEREEQTVISAENDRGAARNDNPADIRTQEAVVRDARSRVAVAQADVNNTELKAPVRGVVSAINGRVGETVGAASGTTPFAPGTTAALPGTADLSSGGSAGGSSGGGGGAGATGGGGAFMVLNNVDSFQLVVPFEESDAARVAPNQKVEVTVDALPDLRAPATVLAVAPSGDPSSGIVQFYATVVLSSGSDPRLRDGQTALASVVVESKDNALRVPSAAVRRDAGGTVVDVRGPDGNPVPTPFTAGAAGDEYTEVVSGLTEGQELLLPQVTVSATPGGPGGGPGGG